MTQLMWIGVGSAAAGAAVACGSAALSEVLDRLNGGYLADLRDRMERLGMDTTRLPLYLRLWRGAVVGSFLVFWLGLGMLPVGVFIAFLVHRLVPLALDLVVHRRRLQVRDQLVIATRNLAGQVRAGMTLEESLTVLSREMPDPFGWQLRRAVNQLAQGRGLRDVLVEMKDRLQMEGVTLLVLALVTAAEKGGKLADVLERAAHSLEELLRVQRKRESDTASGRLVVLVLAAFPAGFLGLFSLLDPRSTGAVFQLLAGQILLVVVGLMVYGSVRWAQRILARVE
jgi:tight adherence protein B